MNHAYASRIEHEPVDRLAAARGIEHAVEQVDFALLLGEEVEQLEPPHVTVLELGQPLEENHRLAVAIAVEQSESAGRFHAQGGADQRHDRRDPRSPRNPDIAPRGPRFERRCERPVRRHDVDHVARAQRLGDPVRKHPARDALDGDFDRALVRRGAQRIITPHLLGPDVGLERQMLPRLESERLGQLGRHLEPDRHRLVGLGHDLGNPQRVEMLGHPTRQRRGRCAANAASPPANGRDARYDARAVRRGSAAGRRVRQVSLRPAPPR